MNSHTRATIAAVLAACAIGVAGCGGGHSDSGKADGSTLRSGVLQIAPGGCAGATPTGSFFRMVQPGGTPDRGPFVTNGDSPCTNKGVTPLSPGTDGGLRIGAYQPQPNPPFAAGGASLSKAVIQPATFFAVPFGLSSNPTDPQTGRKVPAPSITTAGTTMSADLSALSVSWNGQHFNQGAPKPGASGDATGTYEPSTRHYTLDWTSAIKGGPFNGFIGVWHLEGTYRTS